MFKFKFTGFSSGFLLGFGTGFISRDLLANESSYLRPFVKGAMKTSMNAWEKGMEAMSSLGETLEDIMAEIRSEGKKTEARAPTEIRRKKAAQGAK